MAGTIALSPSTPSTADTTQGRMSEAMSPVLSQASSPTAAASNKMSVDVQAHAVVVSTCTSNAEIARPALIQIPKPTTEDASHFGPEDADSGLVMGTDSKPVAEAPSVTPASRSHESIDDDADRHLLLEASTGTESSASLQLGGFEGLIDAVVDDAVDCALCDLGTGPCFEEAGAVVVNGTLADTLPLHFPMQASRPPLQAEKRSVLEVSKVEFTSQETGPPQVSTSEEAQEVLEEADVRNAAAEKSMEGVEVETFTGLEATTDPMSAAPLFEDPDRSVIKHRHPEEVMEQNGHSFHATSETESPELASQPPTSMLVLSEEAKAASEASAAEEARKVSEQDGSERKAEMDVTEVTKEVEEKSQREQTREEEKEEEKVEQNDVVDMGKASDHDSLQAQVVSSVFQEQEQEPHQEQPREKQREPQEQEEMINLARSAVGDEGRAEASRDGESRTDSLAFAENGPQHPTSPGRALPLPPVSQCGAAACNDPPAGSINAFLDGVRLGWAAKFAAVFEAFGLELADDLREAPLDELDQLQDSLKAAGAGPAHLRKIREAIEAWRGDDGAATINAGAAPPLVGPADSSLMAQAKEELLVFALAGEMPREEGSVVEASDSISERGYQTARQVAVNASDACHAELCPPEACCVDAKRISQEELPKCGEDAAKQEEQRTCDRAQEECAGGEQTHLQAAATVDDAEAPEPMENMHEGKEAELNGNDGAAMASPVIATGAEAVGEGPPTEVLLCLDTSFDMHAPFSMASRSVCTWDEADWDAFSQHLRERIEPCRLDALGLRSLRLLTRALQGFDVEVRLCGEDGDASDISRHCPLEAEPLIKRWKRAMRRGTDLWGHTADDVERLCKRGLRCAVIVTGAGEDAAGMEALGRLADVGLPVHVVALGAVGAAQLGGAVAAATGGSFVPLSFSQDIADTSAMVKPALADLLNRLRSLPRTKPPTPSKEPDPAIGLERAARTVQRAERARQQRSQLAKKCLLERTAALRIATAYGRWRFRRSFAAAAEQWRREQKRAPVEAAMRRRVALQREADVEAAARKIQSEWRARRMRLWCQRVDRAARRLQLWCRRRWLRRRLLVEAERLMLRRGRKVDRPPPPPSQWQNRPAAAGDADTWTAQQPPSSPRAAQQPPSSPRGASAALACPPPAKKPSGPSRAGWTGGSGTALPGPPPSAFRGPRLAAAAMTSPRGVRQPCPGLAASLPADLRNLTATMPMQPKVPTLPPASASVESPRHCELMPRLRRPLPQLRSVSGGRSGASPRALGGARRAAGGGAQWRHDE